MRPPPHRCCPVKAENVRLRIARPYGCWFSDSSGDPAAAVMSRAAAASHSCTGALAAAVREKISPPNIGRARIGSRSLTGWGFQGNDQVRTLQIEGRRVGRTHHDAAIGRNLYVGGCAPLPLRPGRAKEQGPPLHAADLKGRPSAIIGKLTIGKGVTHNAALTTNLYL